MFAEHDPVMISKISIEHDMSVPIVDVSSSFTLIKNLSMVDLCCFGMHVHATARFVLPTCARRL